MPVFVKYALTALAGYLLGSLNASIIISKLFFKRDIRAQGSGNAGLTNTLRVLGKGSALAVVVCDGAKGVAAVLIGRALLGERGALLGGMCAILGHLFPLYFGFKGGKGVMTACAVMFTLDWRIASIALGVFIVVVLLTRFVSLGSMLAVLTLPFLALLFGRRDPFFLGAMVLIAAGIVFLHRKNIRRLLDGNENKLSFKKKD